MLNIITKFIVYSLPTLAIARGYVWSLPIGEASVGISVYRLTIVFSLLSAMVASRPLIPSTKIPRQFFYMLLFWTFWGAASLMWTPDLARGFKQILALSFSLGVLIYLNSLGIYRKKNIALFISGWKLSFLVACSVGIWELYTGNHLPSIYLENSPWYVQESVIVLSFFHNPNNFAAFNLLIIPLVLISVVEKGRIKNKLLNILLKLIYLGFVVLSIYFIILIESRAAFLGVLVEIFVIFLLYFSTGKNMLKILAIGGGVLFLLYSLSEIKYNPYSLSMTEQIDNLAKGNAGTSTKSRLNIVLAGINMFMESVGFGIGAGGFQRQAMSYLGTNSQVDPHNFFISILSQYGLIVFFLFLFWVYKVARVLLTTLSSNKVIQEDKITSIGFFSSFIGFGIASIANSTWITTNYVWLYMIAITYFCAYLRGSHRERSVLLRKNRLKFRDAAGHLPPIRR